MLNEKLKQLRKEKGYTQESLAIELNVVRQTVSQWEKGRSVPDAEMLQRIAEVFEVDVSQLLSANPLTNTEQRDELAIQLAKINEQLAIKNRRSKRIWKTVLVIVIAALVIKGVATAVGLGTYLDNSGFPTKINYDITEHSQAITIPEDAVFVNPDDKEDTYQIVTVNNRDYILFGTQSRTITGKMIGDCIAYNAEDNNQRYYSLVYGNDDYIAEYYVNGMMEQFNFLRAVDTVGQDIACPDFVDPLDYGVWKK